MQHAQKLHGVPGNVAEEILKFAIIAAQRVWVLAFAPADKENGLKLLDELYSGRRAVAPAVVSQLRLRQLDPMGDGPLPECWRSPGGTSWVCPSSWRCCPLSTSSCSTFVFVATLICLRARPLSSVGKFSSVL